MCVGLTGLQRDQSLIVVAGDSDNSLSMRWAKLGSMGAINHAAGSGKAITQTCLFGFLIGQGSVMGLVTGCQPLLQGEALALLCQNLRGVGIGQIGAFGFGRISSSCRAVMGMSFFR